MITRRRGRAADSVGVQSVEVEVTDAVQTIEDLPSPSGSLPTVDADDRLADFFGIEDLDWTFDREAGASPLFDMGLDELGFRYAKDCDSGNEEEASQSPSPERTPSGAKAKTRHHQSGSTVNKNAIAARLNRQKKKEYVGGLESKVGALSDENRTLKRENSQLSTRVDELEDETRYLRAVLANESMLAQLLSRLSGMNGMKLSSSLFQGHDSNDHDYALPRKRAKVEEKETSGGVCLHVDKNHVSVEFCTKCAESASTSLRM